MQQYSATKNIAVVNQAAGGNRVLADGLGPAAFGRIERDVIAQPGVKYGLIFEGVNDIVRCPARLARRRPSLTPPQGVADTTPAAQEAIGDQLLQAYGQMVTRMHAAGLPVFGTTITVRAPPDTRRRRP
jgi:hypothetical protein